MNEDLLLMVIIVLSLVVGWLVRRDFTKDAQIYSQVDYLKLAHVDHQELLKRVSELENKFVGTGDGIGTTLLNTSGAKDDDGRFIVESVVFNKE